MEAVLGRFADRIRSAAAQGGRLCLRGGGTKDFYGGPIEGDPFDVRGHAGIVDYEPTELVITARGGTPLAELETALAERNQMLSFEPPHFGAGATLGGCIAAGLSGPRRAANGLYYGAVRDYVLGCSLMDGRGEVMRFGGQVMKNVAGYDVSRLVVGSMGTLGVLLEISLKVLPVPLARTTLRLAMGEAGALAKLNEWGGQPLPISASLWCAGELHVRLEGAAAAVDAATRKLGGDARDDAAAGVLWRGVRDQTDAFFGQPGVLWRMSVPSTAAAIALPGRQLIEWGGALRWWKTDAPAESVREAARGVGGHATQFRGGDRSAGVFGPLDPVVARLERKVKAVFDPAGVFNPFRLHPEW